MKHWAGSIWRMEEKYHNDKLYNICSSANVITTIKRVPSSLNTPCLCISRYIKLIQLSNYRFSYLSQYIVCAHFLGYVFYLYGVRQFTVCIYIQYNVFVRLAIYRVNTPLNPYPTNVENRVSS